MAEVVLARQLWGLVQQISQNAKGFHAPWAVDPTCDRVGEPGGRSRPLEACLVRAEPGPQATPGAGELSAPVEPGERRALLTTGRSVQPQTCLLRSWAFSKWSLS